MLEKAEDEHHPWVIHYNVEAVFDSIRDEPRFKTLARRLGLVDGTTR